MGSFLAYLNCRVLVGVVGVESGSSTSASVSKSKLTVVAILVLLVGRGVLKLCWKGAADLEELGRR